MDLCGPMRIASINGKRYVLVIVDDYSCYTWVHFLILKDEAPEVIKTFLKRIMVLLQTLVEAARTMLIFSRVPLFLWAEAIATACFTQNRFIIHRRFNKIPYELINGRKPDISFLHVFGALCYPKNDREDIGKLGTKGDIGFFIGYSVDSCAYRIYNRRTNKIIDTMNVSFDELSAMAFEQRSSKPKIQTTGRTVSPAQEPQVRQTSTVSSSIADTTPTPTNSSSLAKNIPIISQDVDELNSNVMADGNTFVNPFANSSTSVAASSSSQNNVKEAITDPAWIDSMQEELLQFKRLDVWVLVPAPDNISPLTLKWLFKNKHDEEQTVIRNKSRLVVRGYRQEEGIDFEESFAPSKYVLEILNKYGMESCDPVGTLMEIKDKLDLDQNGTLVDAMKYRSMIGALMYLTSSRPDIVHATCLYARYQAKPTEKHLKEVKRIFHYLRRTVNTGLW
uniref:Gag-Pol polyprotein n=1 Tax=Tanacetum cinerariifolium TaxID=118510 RepID=A0A699K934_TANCI|nr:Gag-Pol polyprotein [Tanacetum cinerariifolium]